MKHKVIMAGALLLMLISCRKESDRVLSYAFNDNMAFGGAERSFVNKFDIIWHGLNTNYALWDFEKENGLDWDAVYDQFRPRFVQLDEKGDNVTDAELEQLVEEMLAPLHDGHLCVDVINHVTGKTVEVWPGESRVKLERNQEFSFTKKFAPSLKYYQANGNIIESMESSNALLSAISLSLQYAQEQLETLTDPTLIEIYTSMSEELTAAADAYEKEEKMECLELYNKAALRYEYMNVPYLEYIVPQLGEHSLNLKYALFDGNIAYLSLDAFSLSPYLDEELCNETFINPSAYTRLIINQVIDTWTAWFNAIQTHHQDGDLGGVIIDMRTNSGGMVNDFQYVLGALLPSGGFQIADSRFKRGSGRYDYSPLMPQFAPTMNTEHAVITEPIVVLCNCSSISMAEMTTLGAKQLNNACVIGTRTWGGLCGLNSNETYSMNYSGHVGEKGKTPVYCYVPQELLITHDGQVLEGYGITPDIELAFDAASWNLGEGPDNQLDRALQKIRE